MAAKAALEKRDTKKAIIHLKSALQRGPDSGEVRYLLGKALLESGDLSAAAVELGKASGLKYSDVLVLPRLAEVMLGLGQSQKLIQTLGDKDLADAVAQADLKANVAAAYLAQGKLELGRESLALALKSDSENPLGNLLTARIEIGSGQIDSALAKIEGVIAKWPKRADALTLKGELLWLVRSDMDGGERALRAAITADPKNLLANSSLLRLLYQKGKVGPLEAQVAALNKALPGNVESKFYEVQIALMRGNTKLARELVQQLIALSEDNANIQQLAGAVNLQAGALHLAEIHLTKALARRPALISARRQLAEVHLRAGQPALALNTLAPILFGQKGDAEALALAGSAYVQLGNLVKAEESFVAAAKSKPDDVRIRTDLAVAQVAQGRVGAGTAQLQVLAESTTGSYADLALISARVRRAEWDEALAAIARLQAKEPKLALPHQLRGQVLLERKQTQGARASFEKALAADPVFMPAVVALSRLDLTDQQPDAALKRFDGVLARDPGNVLAVLGSATLKHQLGHKPEEIETLLTSAIKASPGAAELRLALVEHHLVRHRAKMALTAAEEAVATLGELPATLDALGRAQLAAGDLRRSAATLRKLVAFAPGVARFHLHLAQALAAGSDVPGATAALRKSAQLAPDDMLIQQELVRMLLAGKQSADALQVAKAVQRKVPDEPVGYLLEGDIQVALRALQPAIVAYTAALARRDDPQIAKRLHGLLVAANQPNEADRLGLRWLQQHPKDADFLSYLGLYKIDSHAYAEAETYLTAALALVPNNGHLENNIALLMLKQGKPGALPFAERAHQRLPQSAAAMDTLAQALLADKQLSRAIELQRQAVKQAPEAAAYRLALAKMLIHSGDGKAAREELLKLPTSAAGSQERAEASSLLKSFDVRDR